MGEEGLTAGRFFTIYNPDAAVPIEDEGKRKRFEAKRDNDLAEIHGRMREVEIERAYRIVAALDKTAKDIAEKGVPFLNRALQRWRQRTLWGDGIALGLLLILSLAGTIQIGYWSSPAAQPGWVATLISLSLDLVFLAVLLAIAAGIHFGIRRLAALSLVRSLRPEAEALGIRGDLMAAFERSTKPWRTLLTSSPTGWTGAAKRRLAQIREEANLYVQTLNDRFTNPSGEQAGEATGLTSAPTTTAGVQTATTASD